jgi:hypothetical protein
VARLYAVQLFGRPLSDCGELPSDRDRAAIEAVDGRLELLNARLRDRRRELDDLQARIDRASDQTECNRWIQERNPRVVEFNQRVAEAKGMQGSLAVMIETFNAKLAAFTPAAPALEPGRECLVRHVAVDRTPLPSFRLNPFPFAIPFPSCLSPFTVPLA